MLSKKNILIISSTILVVSVGLFFLFENGFLNNTTLVEDTVVLPTKDAFLCAPSESDEKTISFSGGTCIQPTFEFFIVHLGDDNASLGFTLAQKVQRTKDAFTFAKTKWAAAWSANQMPPVDFTATYRVLVPEGTTVTVPGVTAEYISSQYLTFQSATACTHPTKICFIKDDISSYIGGNANGFSSIQELAYRDPGSWGAGHIENVIKSADNIPVLVVDEVQWYGGLRAGWTDTANGVINMSYLGFHNYELGLFDQAMYNRMLSHEIGHILGLGEDAGEPNNLMTQMSQGGVGFSLDLYQAAKAKSILCTPGLRPVAVGKVQPVGLGPLVSSCKNDRLLHRISGLQEECNPSFSGSFAAASYLNKPITRFCPVVTINGVVQPTPIAMSDDPASPDFYVNVLNTHPGAQVRVCTDTCSCIPFTGSIGQPAIPRQPYPGSSDTVPVPPGACGGPGSGMGNGTTMTCKRKTVGALCGSYAPDAAGDCPSEGWCPAGKTCRANGGACGCVEEDSMCGNGQIDAGETCDHGGATGYSCDEGGTCVNCDCIGGQPEPPMVE